MVNPPQITIWVCRFLMVPLFGMVLKGHQKRALTTFGVPPIFRQTHLDMQEAFTFSLWFGMVWRFRQSSTPLKHGWLALGLLEHQNGGEFLLFRHSHVPVYPWICRGRHSRGSQEEEVPTGREGTKGDTSHRPCAFFDLETKPAKARPPNHHGTRDLFLFFPMRDASPGRERHVPGLTVGQRLWAGPSDPASLRRPRRVLEAKRCATSFCFFF